ncbi:universal stress protein [Pseudonocardia abyssalis]|uniref:Universal stress protein n=1 Tax=Pseudonocardia abyssalis TaxID=2792008 RepID=A0ABS6UTE4_9PSEU|nr:universal stress protein [Pseudonocardia abyssalis]MBW0113870.1 universal stress protein [Pseudonocardia abyssalis]MBW0135133.1 universal stress protein [Pseudonocardia abyssalis]
MDVDGTGTVVVGVDGSPGSRAALEHALQDAARRGSRLRVVAAARLPEYWATAYGMIAPPPVSEVVEQVRVAAQELTTGVTAAHPDLAARVPITVEARAGSAAEVLIDASEGVDLLVVGHRGHGALSSAMLGSVGLQCVLHATCPVTVIPPVPASA